VGTVLALLACRAPAAAIPVLLAGFAASFAAKLADGRRVSVTLMRKGDGFTYSVTVTSGAREHMVYGKGNFTLLRCYVAQQ
jgi:hypothetical protein